MGSSQELRAKLVEILGNNNVYYQPPASIHMEYPAIRFSLSRINTSFANDSVYRFMKSYEVTLIDREKDSSVIDQILSMKYSRFDRYYTANNLNHYVFILYY